MRPFTIYSKISEYLEEYKVNVIHKILSIAKVDRIFLLGASLHRRRSESIFCPSAPTSQFANDFIFAIIVSDLDTCSVYQLQEKIEKSVQGNFLLTTIILEAKRFNRYLQSGDVFACNIYSKAVEVFVNSNSRRLPIPKNLSDQYYKIQIQETFHQGHARIKSFFLGADFFIEKGDFNMTLFMLHQAFEQILITLIKVGSGFRTTTHNLSRLLRLSAMICYENS
ncbi:MAG: hypothetical protein E6Q24_06135 [Chitinophagaceae bacterium]|nr:MAG: hypothetical protein E6Q24_06135 [Chitinophagaceae bacterium]